MNRECLIKSLDEEMEKIDWKGMGKKVAGAATAASIAAGAMGGGATEAKADIGHVKHYLKSMHGQVYDGHKLHITHNDTSRKELKGSKTGSGNFTIHVGDYHIKGKYAATGDGSYNKLQLSKPTHTEDGHQPFEGGLDTRGDQVAEALHDHLTNGKNGLHSLLTSENRKPGNTTGLDVGSFNTNAKNKIKKEEDMDKAEYEKDMSIKGKRGVREERRIDVASSKGPKIGTRLRDFKEGKQILIKALADEGHRESALLLKNWNEMDANAEAMEKSISSTIKNWADDAVPAQAAKKVKVTSMKKEDLAEMEKDEYNDKKVEEKKKQYKDINEKSPDPFKQNIKLAKPKKTKKAFDSYGR